MTPIKQHVSYFMLGLLISLVAISPAHGDDTEIFYLGDTVTPKVMMILDTSGSMGFTVANQENRLTVMKNAMTQFIKSANGTNIGIMRSNQRTSAVVYPVSNLNTSIEETVQYFDRPITADKDNAFQLGETVSVNVNTLNNSPGTTFSFKNSDKIGLRFSNIIIPQGHTVTKAFLQVYPNHSCSADNCSNLSFAIKGEKTINSAEFDSTQANNISNRATTTASVTPSINDWGDTANNKTYKIENIGPVIQEIVNQSGWKSGNALSLIVDTSNVTQSSYGGIKNTSSLYFGSTLFIEVSPYTRTISTRDKLLEELNNQRLTNYTPAVPSLFEAVKYMTGAPLASTHNSTLNTTRNGGNTSYKYNQLFERLPHQASYKNGTINQPTHCKTGWLNDERCRNISISVGETGTLRYKSPIVDTCEDSEARIVMLTDGQATNGQSSYESGGWWLNMTSDISQTINNTNTACTVSGTQSRGYPTTCGVALAAKIKAGIKVEGLEHLQKMKLYTIGFNNNDAWLEAMATAGGGSYKTATNSADLLTAFQEIQGDIIKEAVTFSNTSITLNSSNRLNHNNNLYYALFTPNEQGSWLGNLKHYKLNKNGSIVDQNKAVATDPATGLFLSSSQSFWSENSDGDQITNGGAAQRLKNVTRNIYVNSMGSLTKLNTTLNDSITASDFSLTGDDNKEDHIKWMINSTTIADPLHSTPIEISYGEDGAVIFFGDNQGYIHAIDAATGDELWAFIPKTLLKNQPKVRINAKSSDHIYGMDGKIVKWTENGNTYIASGMRRGGSGYYALNVTNRSTPTLKWIITPESQGFSKLGQTWSTPIKTKIKKGNVNKSVLIFGGGYDPIQDTVTTKTADTKGTGLYIIDVTDGSIIYSETNLNYAIPSDIKAIDIDGDGYTDQVYAGDMGGQVLRFDLDGSSTMSTNVIASVASTGQLNNRRFYHAPDVSVLANTGGRQLAIAIGSGYHAHPNSDAIQDNFYMFKQPIDKPVSTTLITQSDLLEATINIDNELLAAKKGWYLPLNSGGEKVLASSLTFESAVWFTTFQPSIGTNRCIIKRGTSRLYRVNISNGTPNYKEAIPVVTDGKVDITKNCKNTTCTATDRYIELQNASIPPSPVLIHVGNEGDTTSDSGSGSVVCIGTYCKELPKRTSKMNYWHEK